MNRLLRYYFLLLSLCWMGSLWAAADFIIHDVQVQERRDQYLLNLLIDYRLSKVALEALSNGVPLTFELKLRVEKVEGSLWEHRPFEMILQHQIRYHALTGLYRVVDLVNGEQESFVTQDAALYALGEYSNIKLINKEQLDPDAKYRMRLRADLDIESLPLPLRPLAYFHRGWKLSSGWTQWPLKP
jgi:hypothetical protein